MKTNAPHTSTIWSTIALGLGWALILFPTSLVCGDQQTSTAGEVNAGLLDYQEIVLDNGLRVISLEDFSCPIVAVHLWYHVGSKDEDPARQGFAQRVKRWNWPLPRAGIEDRRCRWHPSHLPVVERSDATGFPFEKIADPGRVAASGRKKCTTSGSGAINRNRVQRKAAEKARRLPMREW